MLSGKAFVPGIGIESSCGGVARAEKPRPNIKRTRSSELRNFISSPRSLSRPPASAQSSNLRTELFRETHFHSNWTGSDSQVLPPSQASAVPRISSMTAQNRYVSPRLKNTISLDGGDCCKNVPVRKPARFTAAKKCSFIAQRISRLGWLPTYRALLRFAGRNGTFPKV